VRQLLRHRCAEPAEGTVSKVYHTAIFWLKPETPIATVAKITASMRAMEKLTMVEQVLVGTPSMSDRNIVDDSFGAALAAYNADPHHKKISSEVTLPHVERGVIYDYKNQ
jgi:hypothetical protein